MEKLSSITSSNTMYINTVGYCWFVVDHKLVIRRITSKPFSNYPVNTVRYKNKKYLIDSAFDMVESVSKILLF